MALGVGLTVTSVVLGVIGALMLILAVVIRQGRQVWARALVARPRGSGPQDVLIFLPAIGLLLIGVALAGPARHNDAASIASGLLILVGIVAGVWAIFGKVPKWLRPHWYEPRKGPWKEVDDERVSDDDGNA